MQWLTTCRTYFAHCHTAKKSQFCLSLQPHSAIIHRWDANCLSSRDTATTECTACLLILPTPIRCCLGHRQFVKPSFKAVCFGSNFKAQWSSLTLCFAQKFSCAVLTLLKKVKNKKRCNDAIQTLVAVALCWSPDSSNMSSSPIPVS